MLSTTVSSVDSSENWLIRARNSVMDSGSFKKASTPGSVKNSSASILRKTSMDLIGHKSGNDLGLAASRSLLGPSNQTNPTPNVRIEMMRRRHSISDAHFMEYPIVRQQSVTGGDSAQGPAVVLPAAPVNISSSIPQASFRRRHSVSEGGQFGNTLNPNMNMLRSPLSGMIEERRSVLLESKGDI